MVGIVVCVAAIISMRLFYLQVVRSGYYQKLAISNMIQRERIVAPRGIIRSSDGSKLVVNIPAYQINILPGRIRGQEKRLALACEWLGIGKEQVIAGIRKRLGKKSKEVLDGAEIGDHVLEEALGQRARRLGRDPAHLRREEVPQDPARRPPGCCSARGSG